MGGTSMINYYMLVFSIEKDIQYKFLS